MGLLRFVVFMLIVFWVMIAIGLVRCTSQTHMVCTKDGVCFWSK